MQKYYIISKTELARVWRVAVYTHIRKRYKGVKKENSFIYFRQTTIKTTLPRFVSVIDIGMWVIFPVFIHVQYHSLIVIPIVSEFIATSFSIQCENSKTKLRVPFLQSIVHKPCKIFWLEKICTEIRVDPPSTRLIKQPHVDQWIDKRGASEFRLIFFQVSLKVSRTNCTLEFSKWWSTYSTLVYLNPPSFEQSCQSCLCPIKPNQLLHLNQQLRTFPKL